MNKQKLHAWMWMVAVAGLCGGGCGGLSASRSVSPLDFILPGLIQNTTPPPPAHDGSVPTNDVVFVQHS